MAMSRLVVCLIRTAPWGLAVLAVLIGVAAIVLFGSWAAYFWFQTEPRSVPVGLLWFAVALAVPIAAESDRRYGLRRGERREDLVVRVSATTLVVVWCAIAFSIGLRVVGAVLS